MDLPYRPECSEDEMGKKSKKNKEAVTGAEKTKKRKLIIWLSIVGAFLIAVSGVLLWLFWGSIFKEKTFNIDGIVTVDGAPVSGFVVTSTVGDAITDEEGKYVFTELKGEVSLSVSNELYYFGLEDKTFTDNATFNIKGRSYRPLSGQVISGSFKVPFAKVTIEAENGVYETIADEEGNFEIPKVVGEVKISAEKDGLKLFDKTVKEDVKEVTVNALTKTQINFSFDENIDEIPLGEIKISVNGTEYNLMDFSFSSESIKFGDQIEIISDNYGFDKTSFTITEENLTIDLNAYKKYSVTGVVKSGDTPIKDASVFVNGNFACATDSNGSYTIDGLIKDNQITCSKDGFIKAEKTVSRLDSSADFEILKKVFGKFIFGGTDYLEGTVKVTDQEPVSIDSERKYNVNCKIGDQVSFALEGYYIGVLPFIVTEDTSEVNVEVQKYYSLSISIYRGDDLIDFDADVNISGEEQLKTLNGGLTVNNLYGERSLEILADGYHFEYQKTVSTNSNVVAKAYKLITVSGTVKSGDITLDGKVYLDGKFACDVENGVFTVDNVIESGEITVKADGYDDYAKHVSESDCTVDADLTYSVTVKAKTADRAVQQFKLNVGGTILEVENEYEITGLKGTNSLEFIKDYYTAENIVVTSYCDVIFDASYEIAVALKYNNEAVANRKVILIDNSKETSVEKFTDSEGKVTFDGLNAVYTLIVEPANGIVLKPDKHTVYGGGEYEFSDSGYSFGGRVVCGNEGVALVEVKAGDKRVWTDEDGYFNFPLVSSDCVLTLEKSGYSFDKNGMQILEDEHNGSVIEISATYTISGTVKSGNQKLCGVTVKLGDYLAETDENGYYFISGIETVNEKLTFSLEGYEIDGFTVTGAGEFDAIAYANVTFTFVCGDLSIDGVNIKVSGKAVDKYLLGDIVTFEKAGYTFESITITQPQCYEINGTYKVTGAVKNGDSYVQNAEIQVNGVTVTQTNDGTFTLEGLSGTSVISAKFGTFEFSSATVNSPADVLIQATYTVIVTAKCKDALIEGATVKVADKEVKTDQNGVAVISGLTGKNLVNISKDGYTFESAVVVDGAREIVYQSTYAITGTIKCGAYPIVGATIKAGLKFTTTDKDGKFTIVGLTGENEFEVSAEGYEGAIFVVTEPETQNLNLKYNVLINFTGLSDYSGITIKCAGETFITENLTNFTLYGLSGRVTIEFIKDGYQCTPSVMGVDNYKVQSVLVQKVYAISGKVTTASGTPVVGLKMSAGGKTAYTDSNGNYTINGLVGETQVSGSYPISAHNCALSAKEVKGEGTFNFSEISENDYAWGLYLNGMNNLINEGKSYEIVCEGKVKPNTGPEQKVGSVKRKDANGNIVTENLNYGKETAGVKTSVALVTFYNSSSKKVYHAEVGGPRNNYDAYDKYVFSDLTAIYPSTSTWETWTYGEYKTKLGNYVDGILPYKIEDGSVSEISYSKSGSDYKLTIKLKTDSSSGAWSGYATQMKYLSGQSVNSFSKINLSLTLDKNGFIKAVSVDEGYNVKATALGISVNMDISATLNYTYKMPSLEYSIGEFEMSNGVITDNGLKQALNRSI